MSCINWDIAVPRPLQEAITMFDAAPMYEDLSKAYNVGSYCIRASLLHTALEQGMKAMRQRSFPKAKPCKGHALNEVYKATGQANQRLLEAAFTDAVKFYGFRPQQPDQAHLTDLRKYFAETGQEKRFQEYRYWAVEEKEAWLDEPLAVLRINRELVRFMADLLSKRESRIGGPFTVSQLVENKIKDALFRRRYQPLPQREQTDYDGWKADDDALTGWLSSHTSLLSAMRSAFEQRFAVVNEQASRVLRRVYNDLAEEADYRTKPALRYALETFQAVSANCPVTPPATFVTNDKLRWSAIQTPAGTGIGLAEERHDGLWHTESLGAPNTPLIAKSKEDAIAIIVLTGTHEAFIRVNGGLMQETRAHFRGGDPRWRMPEDFVCELWNENRSVAKDDKITIKINPASGERPYQISGTVASCDGHKIEITDARRET